MQVIDTRINDVYRVAGGSLYFAWANPMTIIETDTGRFIAAGDKLVDWQLLEGQVATIAIEPCKRTGDYTWAHIE